jgi:drug/metabolite transporter (DMT)-like permease
MALAYAALGAAVVLWGVSFPVMKFAVARLGPFDVAVYRIVLGALGSLGLCLVDARRSRVDLRTGLRRHFGTLLILSALVGYGQNFPLTYGIALTPATIGSLIPPLNPILTMLLASWWLGEQVGPRQWAGMAVALTGVVLLTLRQGVPTWETVSGPLLLAIAPTSWAVYTVVSKPLLREVNPASLTALTLVGGAVLVMPLGGASSFTRLGSMTGVEWAAILFLGLVAMTIAYGLWYAGLARVGAAATGATVLGIPLVGVVSTWALLGEPIGPIVIVAGALILVGLRLVLSRRA